MVAIPHTLDKLGKDANVTLDDEMQFERIRRISKIENWRVHGATRPTEKLPNSNSDQA